MVRTASIENRKNYSEGMSKVEMSQILAIKWVSWDESSAFSNDSNDK